MKLPDTDTEILQLLASQLDARLIHRGPLNIPYLWRAYFGDRKKKDEEIGCFLHRFVASDELDEVHCHPWDWSISFILAGSYTETRATGSLVFAEDGTASANLSGTTRIRMQYDPGDNNFILRSTFHRIELITSEVWTLFIHGPRSQDGDGAWGFVPAEKYGVDLPVRLIKGRTFDRLPKVDMPAHEESK